MSFFSEANKDSDTVPLSAGAFGPRLGFFDSFEAGREAQMRGNSMFGLEAAFREAEQEQIREIKRAGGTPPRSLNDSEDGVTSGFTGGVNSRRYLDAARYFQTGEDRDGIGDVLASRETELASFAEKNPNAKLRNYREIFDTVRERAQAVESKWENSDTSFGGMVGGFLGTAIGSVDPRTDPLNTLTLPIGAVGKTIGQRVASQGFGQGAIEAVNQLTGVQENRRLLGLESGLSQGALAVASAAVGGAALQGIGEGAAALGRRWFRNTAKDPAPPVPETPQAKAGTVDSAGSQPGSVPAAQNVEPVPTRVNLMEDFEAFKAAVVAERKPLGVSRRGEAVAEADAAHFARQLDDWKGPRPWEVPPRTDTTVPGEVTTSRLDRPFDRAVDNLDTLDDVARRLDPETFRIYDKLDATANRLRGWIADLDAGRLTKATESVQGLEAQIAALEAKIAKASAKNQPRLQRELAELQGAREVQFEAVRGSDTTDQAAVRMRLQEIDQQMRDLAPLVSRAYGQAEGEWRASGISAENLGILRDLQNRGSVPFKAEEAPPVAMRTTLVDEMPLLTSRPDVTNTLPASADAADKIKAVVAAEAKALDPAIANFRSTIAKMIEPGEARTISQADLATRDKDGVLTQIEGAADKVMSDVRRALGEGAKVTLWIEGKPRNIVDVSTIGLKDEQGHPWGVAAIRQPLPGDNARIEIVPNQRLTFPNGRSVDLDKDVFFVPNESGEGSRKLTFRQYLAEIEQDEQALKAVGSCSIR